MTDAVQEGTFLHFRVGECELALEVTAVDEVVRLGTFTDLGRQIPGVDGAIPLHGQVVPVVYLSRLLEIEAEDPEKAVVARGKGRLVALGVDDVIGLYENPSLAPETTPIPGLLERGVRQIHRRGPEIICWLDVERIFSEEGWEAIRSLSEMETDGLLGDTTLDILGY